MERARATSTHNVGHLLSVVKGLSPWKVRMVTLYAENLRDKPISEIGKSYIAMLLEEGASSDEILVAAQAIRDVDSRLAREADFQAGLDDLHRRTDEQFQHWCRERGIDYKALSEEAFGELIEQAIRQIREGK